MYQMSIVMSQTCMTCQHVRYLVVSWVVLYISSFWWMHSLLVSHSHLFSWNLYMNLVALVYIQVRSSTTCFSTLWLSFSPCLSHQLPYWYPLMTTEPHFSCSLLALSVMSSIQRDLPHTFLWLGLCSLRWWFLHVSFVVFWISECNKHGHCGCSP